MGCNIVWTPRKSDRQLGVDARSTFVEAMRKAFGESPWHITISHQGILKGMAAADLDGATQLLDVLMEYEDVDVRVVW